MGFLSKLLQLLPGDHSVTQMSVQKCRIMYCHHETLLASEMKDDPHAQLKDFQMLPQKAVGQVILCVCDDRHLITGHMLKRGGKKDKWEGGEGGI